jgi:hypothetical protein
VIVSPTTSGSGSTVITGTQSTAAAVGGKKVDLFGKIGVQAVVVGAGVLVGGLVL